MVLFRQDSIDLFLGNYKILNNESKFIERLPMGVHRDYKYFALPVFGLATFSMFIVSLIIPSESFQEQIMYVLFWGFATLCTLGIMLYFGKELVNTPKLVQVKSKDE